jgi:hypothetical protein
MNDMWRHIRNHAKAFVAEPDKPPYVLEADVFVFLDLLTKQGMPMPEAVFISALSNLPAGWRMSQPSAGRYQFIIPQ